MEWLAGLLAKKAAMLGVCAMALVGVIALPAALWQTARLDGITVPFFGWRLTDGAIQQKEKAEDARDKALEKYGVAHNNQIQLSQALDKQNGKLRDMQKQFETRKKLLEDGIKQAVAGRDAAERQVQRIAGMHIATTSAADAALSIDAIALRGIQR